VDSLTWELKLRPNVSFHDGTPFTGDDVAFSLKRARDVPNSPGPLASFRASGEGTEVIDKLTIRIQPTSDPTADGYGGAHLYCAGEAWCSVTTADFAAGKAMIGTGAYRFKQAIPGDKSWSRPIRITG